MTYPDGRVRRLIPRECEGLQGFPTGWTRPDDAAHKDDDQDDIDTLRYQALGNAVTPSVAKWLGLRIARYLQLERVDSDRVNKMLPAFGASQDGATAALPLVAAQQG